MDPTAADGPVCLAPCQRQSSPGRALSFQDFVHPEHVSRCSTLSCIAEAGGEAQLPGSVSVSEFRTWIVCNSLKTEECSSLHFSTLCAVIKVRPMFVLYTRWMFDSAASVGNCTYFRTKPSSAIPLSLQISIEYLWFI